MRSYGGAVVSQVSVLAAQAQRSKGVSVQRMLAQRSREDVNDVIFPSGFNLGSENMLYVRTASHAVRSRRKPLRFCLLS